MKTQKDKSNKTKAYTSRMIIGGLIGFIMFACIGVVLIYATGQIRSIDNPYIGPPPMMTVLLFGTLGIILGALISLIKRSENKND